VFVQTVRLRDYFMDDSAVGQTRGKPSNREAGLSLGLLLVALVAVVGLAKITSPTIEAGVLAAGLPLAVVGVIIAMVVLLPEALAAIRAAGRDRVHLAILGAFIALSLEGGTPGRPPRRWSSGGR
jgi:Ca2+:H+ antiporter